MGDSSLKFGTSGVRGLATDLLAGGAAAYALAFCHVLVSKHGVNAGTNVLLAHDHRASSPQIAEAVGATVASCGLAPVFCGAVPTPALALAALQESAPAIMVTGSHIPADRNGLKFYRPDGEIDKADERAIGDTFDGLGDSSERVVGEPMDGVPDGTARVLKLYFARNIKLAQPSALAGLKIGVYAHTSVAVAPITAVLSHFGAKVVTLGAAERFVPVDTESISADMRAQFAVWTTVHGLDAIVSTDADGDRPLVTDEAGIPLPGDLLGYIAAAHVGAPSMVTPVSSNSAIKSSNGRHVVRTRIGSPYVLAAMAASDLKTPVVGFEANGGTLLQNTAETPGGTLSALPTRDAMLPIVATLIDAQRRGVALSKLTEIHGMANTFADRLTDYPNAVSAVLLTMLTSAPEDAAAFLSPFGTPHALDTTDGARFSFDDGRIVHFRPSGNAPELRCYSEAKSPEEAAQLVSTGLALATAFRTSLETST
ncbi:MAG: phosphomannomutase [Pseudomonadota bacterium]